MPCNHLIANSGILNRSYIVILIVDDQIPVTAEAYEVLVNKASFAHLARICNYLVGNFPDSIL